MGYYTVTNFRSLTIRDKCTYGRDYPRDTGMPRIHPTQKSVPLLERLIEIFTDKGDVVIDPTAGSGSSLLAAANLSRRSFGFEIDKGFFKKANEIMLKNIQPNLFV